MWKGCLILLLLVILAPVGVFADNLVSYANITVTAQGYTGTAPYGLTVTYISDYELEISWNKGYDTNVTMIRAAYGRPLIDRSDGFEVYTGNGTSTILWTPNVGLVGPIYLGAWSQSNSGVWEELGDKAEGNFMSVSFLFVALLILGLTLFIAAFRWKDMLLSYSSALTWMGIGFWWMAGGIDNFGLDQSWVRILVFIPFILSFAVLLRLMNTEIIMESKGKKWSEFGETPKEEAPSRREVYREVLRKRIR